MDAKSFVYYAFNMRLPLSLALIATFFLTACSVFGFFSREYKQNPDPNHTHADFAVYIEGEKLDFSDPKYMSSPPAKTESSGVGRAFAHGDEDDGHILPERKYLHLHDVTDPVIHAHKPGLTIGEFFASIGFLMTEQCFTLDTEVMVCPEEGKKWQMFVNANEQPFDPSYSFKDMDKILLTYGASAEDVKMQLEAMTDDACKYSKTCPWKGDPPTEGCIADPEVPCVIPPEDL